MVQKVLFIKKLLFLLLKKSRNFVLYISKADNNASLKTKKGDIMTTYEYNQAAIRCLTKMLTKYELTEQQEQEIRQLLKEAKENLR